MTALMTLLEAGAVLQPGISRAPEVDPGVGLGGSAFGAFLSTLLIGAIMIALVPGYTERLVDRVDNDIVGSFIYGLIVLVALIVLIVLLAVTLIGIPVAILLAILVGLIWAVGAVVGFLAIGERLVGSEDGWLKPLVVGALINGGLTLTGIGGLVSFVVGATGFGTVMRDWRE
ncbi:hypothetical protein [Salinibaculum salinum]|uniref:hypothetical protein n=1 Tax=Salinibaculum salinum TaxID=3131996 RepID=UPI0030EE315D